MAFNLWNLLGSQIGSLINPQDQTAAVAPPSDEIVVNGQNPQAQAPQVQQTPIFEAPNVDRIDVPPGMLKEMMPRKGMFGTKGTLRDILGVVGDAFLLQSGNKPIYAPQREREKMGDALYGFSDNPLAAVERLAAQGYPDQAAELYKNYQTNQTNRYYKEALAADRSYKQLGDVRNRAARYLSMADTPEKRAYALQLIRGLASQANIPVEQVLGSNPDDLSDLQRNILGVGDMTVNQQNMMGYRQEKMAQDLGIANRRLGIQQQNANTSSGRAAEVRRSNRVKESQAGERIDISRNKGATRTRTNRPPNSKGPAKSGSGWGDLRRN